MSNTFQVSIVIKVCQLDAEYIDKTIPHMIAQANFQFKERIVLWDQRETFFSKYRDRGAVPSRDIGKVLSELVEKDVIDQEEHFLVMKKNM